MEHYLYLLTKLQYPGRHHHFYKVLSHKVHFESEFHISFNYDKQTADLSKPLQPIHHTRIVLVPVNQKLQQQLTKRSVLINGSNRKF